MNIDLVARNIELDDQLRAFAHKQVGKAVRFLEEPVDARLILEAAKHRRVADLHLAHRYGVIQASDETNDVREAIRLAVEKARKQAKRSRKKSKLRKRRARRPEPSDWPVAILDAATLEAESGPAVVERSRLVIETMRLEQAAAALASADRGFVVYRDAASDRINVLYLRDDGQYGLVSPEF